MSEKLAKHTETESEMHERARFIEAGFDMESSLQMIDRLVVGEENRVMEVEWEEIRPEVAQSRSYFERFGRGVEEGREISEALMAGHEFTWWDVDGYREQMRSLRDVISKGQFVNVLGDYALNVWTGTGPTIRANHDGFFSDQPLFLNALTEATVTNFGGSFGPHSVAVEAALKLCGGSRCSAYTPGPFMEQVAASLIDISPTPSEGARVAYFNSGGDSVSVAIAAAEKKAKESGHPERTHTVCFKEAYHGNIEGRAGRVTSGINEIFNGTNPSITLEFPNEENEVEPVLSQLKHHIKEGKVAAVVMEAIQGDGGGIEMHPDFFVEMMKLTIDHDVPVIVDEVQSGFKRTGRTWAVNYLLDHWRASTYVQEGGYPDQPPLITAVAKSMTNGAAPGSAVIFPKEYAVLERAQGLNTYSAHPTTLAATHVTTELMKEPEVAEMVKRKRRLFESEVAGSIGEGRFIKGIRGRGLMLFLEVEDNQLLQAEMLGRKRVLAGTVARRGFRVHLPLNAEDVVWQAVARATCDVAEQIERGEVSDTARYVLAKGGPSGLAVR